MRFEHTPQQPSSDPRDFGRRLEHWIESGVWPEGGLLPTRDELTRIFGSAELEYTREVIDGLHRRGILIIRPEDGRLVIGVKGGALNSSTLETTEGNPGPDYERWRLVNEARKALLTQAARLAATRASDDIVMELRHLLEHPEIGESVETAATGGEDAFEREVVVAAGNDLMVRIYDRLMILEATTRVNEGIEAARTENLTRARREVLTAIAARQPTAAALLADRIL
ncbi:FadR/GntR family transcriptional regulator [Arthrobacter woluwensis]|uniref:DNA-binding transcriptional regulator, FadR family n=1 Tax=Arthrobacter woluwensis TaxID=156980 RepID=A0A1H4JR75_9MICC|nr:FCD domain-containing protein [Arthrobacter woluwensis]SEB48834.1 DNA-binding transcriptional regulator, FadR family [Arthrobacter woluwensis]